MTKKRTEYYVAFRNKHKRSEVAVLVALDENYEKFKEIMRGGVENCEVIVEVKEGEESEE